jgi:hypothetical protein
MTKKHFEALAAALAEQRVGFSLLPSLKNQHAQWCRDVQAVANVCARFNPNFDRARFLKACGVEG